MDRHMGRTVVSHETGCERVRRSCTGICAGMAIFLAGLCLAGWNEYRSVATAKMIARAEEAYVEAGCSPILEENDRQLIHFSCPLSNLANFRGVPGLLGQELLGIRLARLVEIYEWVEESETTERDDGRGGKTSITTYHYSKQWRQSYIDTASFDQPGWCGNVKCSNPRPDGQPWWASGPQSLGITNIGIAPRLQAGDFVLPEDLVMQLGSPPRPLTPTCQGLQANPGDGDTCPSYVDIQGFLLCYRDQFQREGREMDAPGDVRVQYSLYNATEASVLAQQTGAKTGPSLQPWKSPYDKAYTMYMAEDGQRSAYEMLVDAENSNTLLTWGLRAVSWVFVCLAINISMSPIATIASTLPCVGSLASGIASSAICMLSILLGSCFWLLVAGATWIAFRPYIGVPLVIASAGVLLISGWWKRYQDHKWMERVTNPILFSINPEVDFAPMMAAVDEERDWGTVREGAELDAKRSLFCFKCGDCLQLEAKFCAECGCAT